MLRINKSDILETIEKIFRLKDYETIKNPG